MAELSLREQLQPALLDRLTDDERVISLFDITVSRSELERLGLRLGDRLAILTAQGLRHTNSSDEDLRSGPDLYELEFVAAGQSVGPSRIRELVLTPPGAPQGVRLQEFCTVEARTSLN